MISCHSSLAPAVCSHQESLLEILFTPGHRWLLSQGWFIICLDWLPEGVKSFCSGVMDYEAKEDHFGAPQITSELFVYWAASVGWWLQGFCIQKWVLAFSAQVCTCLPSPTNTFHVFIIRWILTILLWHNSYGVEILFPNGPQREWTINIKSVMHFEWLWFSRGTG